MSEPTRPSASSAGRAPSARSFTAVLLLIAVAGVGTLAYLTTHRPATPARRIDTTGVLPDARGQLLGDTNAPVEITMFGDFECPGCGHFATVIEPEVRTHLVQPGLARFRFMDFPLSSHPNSLVAHNAAACAGAQNHFWEMHDRLYSSEPPVTEALSFHVDSGIYPSAEA